MEQYDNIVELIDEQGESVEFEYLMSLDYNGKEYILLKPIDEENQYEDNEVIILRVEQDQNGDDIYTSIEDEEEANEVLDVFNQVINQYEYDGNS